MAAHILQVAYYPALLETRSEMLRKSGYRVTSVLGNEKAMALPESAIAAADLVVVGFSTVYSMRAAMVHWFKAHHPRLCVIALKSDSEGTFSEADASTASEDPKVWLAAVVKIVKP